MMLLVVVSSAPVPLIIDTDLGFDVDDVGALSVANHLQDIGKAHILGVVHNTGFSIGIGGANVIMNYYGRGNQTDYTHGAYYGPWGGSDKDQEKQNAYTSTIQSNFPSPVSNQTQVYSAVDAYNDMLNRAEDSSVVIASIGELTNLRDILKANRDLFVQKVKMIYYMNGLYNFGCGFSRGSGWSPFLGNTTDCYGAAQYVIENVPKSIKQVFSPDGVNVWAGSRFNGQRGCGQGPVKQAYQIYTNNDARCSWDPLAVYLAVMGDHSLWSNTTEGTDHISYDGSEVFNTTETGNNQFTVNLDGTHNDEVGKMLDDILCAAPCLNSDQQVGGCASYLMHSSKNCGTGHGATNLEKSEDASAGTMSLSDCMKLCDSTDECQGISVSQNVTSTPGFINCYRRGNIDIENCQNTFAYDTYVREPKDKSKNLQRPDLSSK